jgi:hypothetical protein
MKVEASAVTTRIPARRGRRPAAAPRPPEVPQTRA